eukprot:1638764-Alexandrium_andersonii.AAC.1
MFAHRARACKAGPAKATTRPQAQPIHPYEVAELAAAVPSATRSAMAVRKRGRDAASLGAQDLCWEAHYG